MTKKNIKRVLKFCGYEINPINQSIEYFDDMNLFKYLNNDGSFDYEQYKNIQIETNKRKIKSSWVNEENVHSNLKNSESFSL